VASGLTLVVPYDKSPAGLRGLETAFRIAKSEKNSEVHAVYVVVVDRRMPLDADLPDRSEQGELCVAEAEEMARHYKIKGAGEILQARDAGHAIVDEALELSADAIVIGVPRPSREGMALDLGKTSEYILSHAPCEVIMVRGGTDDKPRERA
jgi:nucleotide-binding universal stress UspA family protein